MSDDLDNSASAGTSEDISTLEEGSNDDALLDKADSSETEVEEKEEKEESVSEKEEEVEELEEEKEEEEEEETEEETDKEEQIARPSWKELKEKFPGIEKNEDFRQMYFREKAFSDIYPTVAEAKVAADKANTLDYFDESLREGDPTVLLQALASSSPETVAGMAEKFLPSLHNLSPKLFARATKDLIADIVNDIYDHGERNNDNNLKQSIANICKYLYGDFRLPVRPGRIENDPEIIKERERLRSERDNIFIGRRDEFVSKVDKSIDRQLEQILSEGIETDNDFIKRSIVRDTIDEMKSVIKTDEYFKANFKRLLSQAARAGFTPEWRTRIISAYLGRAKGLALTARSRIKAEALRERQSTERRSNRRVEAAEKGDRGLNKGGKSSSKHEFYKNNSDMDIILGKG